MNIAEFQPKRVYRVPRYRYHDNIVPRKHVGFFCDGTLVFKIGNQFVAEGERVERERVGDIKTKSDQRPLVVNEVASRCCGGRAWDRHGNQIGELTTPDLVLGLDLRGAPGKVWFRSGHVEIDRSVRTRDHCGLRGLIVASQNGQVLRDSAHGIP